MKIQSEGKRLGKIVLVSYLIIIFNIIVILNFDLILNQKINIQHWLTIAGFMLTSLAITWGAKASSNFAKAKIQDYREGSYHGGKYIKEL